MSPEILAGLALPAAGFAWFLKREIARNDKAHASVAARLSIVERTCAKTAYAVAGMDGLIKRNHEDSSERLSALDRSLAELHDTIARFALAPRPAKASARKRPRTLSRL